MTTAVKKTAKKTCKGILPTDQWLRAKGLDAMADAMKAHPKLFSHIKQRPDGWTPPASKPGKPKPKAAEADYARLAKRLVKDDLFRQQLISCLAKGDKAVAAGATRRVGNKVFRDAVEEALTIWTDGKAYDRAKLRASVLCLVRTNPLREQLKGMLAEKAVSV